MSPRIAGQRRLLHFSTATGVGVIAVTIMAVVALGMLLLPSGDTAPIAVVSPSATATTTAEATSPSLEPSFTPAPTIAPTPIATAEPTPAPPGGWTALTWSDPATPSSVIHLYDLVSWGDGYVAGGTFGEGSTRAAFLTSPDGLDWTVVYHNVYRQYPSTSRWPRHLVDLDGQLLAFSHSGDARAAADRVPVIWQATSADGSTWGRVQTSGWDEAWSTAAGAMPDTWILEQQLIETGLVDVAASAGRIVAIGNSYAADGDGVVPVILYSTDGQSWAPTALPAASGSAMLNSIVEHHGRFVLTGAVGRWA
jgi:hypothetical protein